MQPPRPIQSDQYSPDSFVPVFQEDVFSPAKFDGDERDEEPVMCGMITALPAGFIVSFLIAVEGCVVLANLFGTESGASSILPGLQRQNPYRHVQLVVLEVIGIANLIACFAIMVGIWLTRRAMPRLLRRFFDVSQVRFSIASLGVALAYRALLLVAVAPWFGFMMAYESRNNSGLRLLMMTGYIALSAYIVWVLICVVMSALGTSQKLQDRLSQQDAEERYNLLGQAYDAGWPCPTEPVPLLMEASPTLFGCLPLEPTVILYMWVVLVACIFWLIRLFLNGGGSGGWAFFTRLPPVSSTLGLEIFLNLFTAAFSLITLSAVLLQPRPWESADPWRTRKRVTVTLLLYFIVGMMRFALFFPVTGMAIASKDLCGLYSHAISDLSINTYPTLPLHCTSSDAVALLLVFATFAIDGYLLSGVFKLWQIYRAEYLIGGQFEAAGKAMGKFPAMGGWGAGAVPGRSYGIADPRPM